MGGVDFRGSLKDMSAGNLTVRDFREPSFKVAGVGDLSRGEAVRYPAGLPHLGLG